MDKTTLYLDSEHYRRLKRVAFRRRVAPAALVREAIAEYVNRYDTVRVARSVGAARSGRADIGERAEELLAGFGTSR
jgi:predicted transcriptional regulator